MIANGLKWSKRSLMIANCCELSEMVKTVANSHTVATGHKWSQMSQKSQISQMSQMSGRSQKLEKVANFTIVRKLKVANVAIFF